MVFPPLNPAPSAFPPARILAPRILGFRAFAWMLCLVQLAVPFAAFFHLADHHPAAAQPIAAREPGLRACAPDRTRAGHADAACAICQAIAAWRGGAPLSAPAALISASPLCAAPRAHPPLQFACSASLPRLTRAPPASSPPSASSLHAA